MESNRGTGVSKRGFIAGVGGITAAATAPSAAGAPRRGSGTAMMAPPLAGALDLGQVPVIDSHMHPLARASITQKYDEQAQAFAHALLDAHPQADSGIDRVALQAEFHDQVMGVSRRIGYFNYVARVYGVPPTLAGFDRVLATSNQSDRAFADHVRRVLDRENIGCVVLQSRAAEPVRPATAIPPDRFVWTYRFSDLISAEWARQRGLSDLQAVVAAIDTLLETAVRNGCRGFKNDTTYFRSLTLAPVSAAEAQRALDRLLAAQPKARNAYDSPIYADDALTAASRTYQDFVFRHVYLRAGQLGRPIVIHSAVALHPALRPAFNDPAPLYEILTDPAIVAAGTRFIVIHAGYPAHDLLAAMNSQFPRLFVDVSHISKYPGALEAALRALIGLGPTTKILHGSDAGTVPDEIGYCATNTRHVLGRILTDYGRFYGWTQSDLDRAANDILHANARRLFQIPS